MTATRNTAFEKLGRLMDDEELGDLIIVEDNRPAGIGTDSDIVLAASSNETLEGLTVRHESWACLRARGTTTYQTTAIVGGRRRSSG